MPPKPFSLTVTARRTGRPFVRIIRRQIPLARAMLPAPLRELSIALVGDTMMARLHHQFMNLPTPTDVLTFPLEFDSRRRPLAGEVVICIPEARRQARSTGVTLSDEVLLYALHGLLHLCGFDDKTNRAFKAMHRKEDQILSRLGFGRVFAPSAARHTLDQTQN